MKFLGSEALHMELRLGFLFMMCYVVRIDGEKNFVGNFNPAYKTGCFKWK